MIKELFYLLTFGTRNSKRLISCIDMLSDTDERNEILKSVQNKFTGDDIKKLKELARKELPAQQEKKLLNILLLVAIDCKMRDEILNIEDRIKHL